MMMNMSSVNTNVQNAGVCESLNQNLTATSRISILLPTTQTEGIFPSFPFGILAEVPMTPVQFDADLTMRRVAGAAKGRIKMAPDFDAPLEW